MTMQPVVNPDPPSASFILQRAADLLEADHPRAASAIRSAAGTLGADLADWRDVPVSEAQAAADLLARHVLPVVEEQAGAGNHAAKLGRLLTLGLIVGAALRAVGRLDDPHPAMVFAVLGSAFALARFPVAVPAYFLTMTQGREPDVHALDPAGAKAAAGCLLACAKAVERLAVRADDRHGLRAVVGILSDQVARLLIWHRHGADAAAEAV